MSSTGRDGSDEEEEEEDEEYRDEEEEMDDDIESESDDEREMIVLDPDHVSVSGLIPQTKTSHVDFLIVIQSCTQEFLVLLVEHSSNGI